MPDWFRAARTAVVQVCLSSWQLFDTTSKVSRSTSDIKDGALLASHQCHQFADRLIWVRAPEMIDRDKARIFELFCILQAKMAGGWLH